MSPFFPFLLPFPGSSASRCENHFGVRRLVAAFLWPITSCSARKRRPVAALPRRICRVSHPKPEQPTILKGSPLLFFFHFSQFSPFSFSLSTTSCVGRLIALPLLPVDLGARRAEGQRLRGEHVVQPQAAGIGRPASRAGPPRDATRLTAGEDAKHNGQDKRRGTTGGSTRGAADEG